MSLRYPSVPPYDTPSLGLLSCLRISKNKGLSWEGMGPHPTTSLRTAWIHRFPVRGPRAPSFPGYPHLLCPFSLLPTDEISYVKADRQQETQHEEERAKIWCQTEQRDLVLREQEEAASSGTHGKTSSLENIRSQGNVTAEHSTKRTRFNFYCFFNRLDREDHLKITLLLYNFSLYPIPFHASFPWVSVGNSLE